MSKKKVNKVLGMPKQLREELEEVRKKFKNKPLLQDKEIKKHIKECNSIINEINSYKKSLTQDKQKMKYALNFDFPIRKKENGKK